MIAAVTVARSGSIRLPGKALLPFAGTTLIGHKVRTLCACQEIDKVYVGSDSPEILDAGAEWGGIPIRRDAYHCDESKCSANEMIADMASKVDADVIVWAHPTNPMVRSGTYDEAVKAYSFAIRGGDVDSLVSVTPVKRHAWLNQMPFNFNPWQTRHPLASELSPIHFQDGSIFIQSRKAMVANRYFYGRHPLLFEIDSIEGLDIDTPQDMAIANAVWNCLG